MHCIKLFGANVVAMQVFAGSCAAHDVRKNDSGAAAFFLSNDSRRCKRMNCAEKHALFLRLKKSEISAPQFPCDAEVIAYSVGVLIF
jgi:hypothetical protein